MLIQDAVAPAAHTALEDELFFTVGVESRSRTAIHGTRGRTAANVFRITTNGPRDRTDSGTEPGTFGDTFANAYLVCIGFTFVPVANKLFLVDTLHIDDRVGVCCAATKGCRKRNYWQS